jgi:hypothetical protein
VRTISDRDAAPASWTLASYSALNELDAIEAAWDRLCEQELQFVPSFAELLHQLEDGSRFRILAAIENSQIVAIACFIYSTTTKSYKIAARTLFQLPIRELFLFGSCVLGKPSEDVIRIFFRTVTEASDFDLINVGEIFVDSPLYRAMTGLDNGLSAWRVARKNRLWWLIRLPDSFDEYVAALPKSTSAHITRDYRYCERQGVDFQVMLRPEDVETFLAEAEKISRLTYQWTLGLGTRNDEPTRQRLIRLAKGGILRCYIVYLRGEPCAFGWGELSHGTFVFQRTGYDPRQRKFSPGTTLIMRMIRDLIENTDCEVFDFMWGGDDGYKSRLGNVSFECVHVEAAQIHRPFPLLIAALDQLVLLPKRLMGVLIERHAHRQRFKTLLRRCGIGTF